MAQYEFDAVYELLAQGLLDEAERWLDALPRGDESEFQLLKLYGILAFKRGSYSLALSLFAKALQLEPEDSMVYVTCGQAHRALGDLRSAEYCLREALRLEPGRHDAHLNLGLTLWAAGDQARAGTYFRNVLTLAKKSATASFYLGQLHELNGEATLAIDCFRDALELQPDNAEWRLHLAKALSSLGSTQDALSECRKVLSVTSSAWPANSMGAQVAFELGFESEAISYLDNALRDSAGIGAALPMVPVAGILGRMEPWCQRQNIEVVRVARAQRHKVRSVQVLPVDSTLQLPEPNTPDIHVAVLNSAGVLPEGHLVMSPDRTVFLSGIVTRPLHRPFTNAHIVHAADDGRVLLRIPQKVNRLAAQVAYLGRASNYLGWLLECVTRLWAYQQRSSWGGVPVLVQSGLTQWQTDILELLGYDSSRRIVMPDDALTICESLLVASLSAPLNFLSPFALEFMRRKLRAGTVVGKSSGRRIFLSRANSSSRRLSNLNELSPILEDHGFELVSGDTGTLQELLNLLRAAEIIVGIEGASMANTFIAPANARIGLITTDMDRAMGYSAASRTLGQEFTFLSGRPEFESSERIAECDIYLEPQTLTKFLSSIRDA